MVVHEEAPADAPLRRDVRLLGDLLGRMLVEQEDESLLDDVERVRALARAARAGAPHDELIEGVAALPIERQANVLRAFALYFQLTNVAEQQHRVRRRRAYEVEQRVPPESLADAFAKLDGIPQSELERRVSLQLVLTAHPTEATRRTVLESQRRAGPAARVSARGGWQALGGSGCRPGCRGSTTSCSGRPRARRTSCPSPPGRPAPRTRPSRIAGSSPSCGDGSTTTSTPPSSGSR